MLAAARRHRARPTWPPSSAAWRRSRDEIERGAFEWKLELEDVHLNIEARLIAARRRRRQAPAHRPLAQRPGRHRRAPVAARRDRPASARCWPSCSAPWSSSPTSTRRDHPARLHAPAGGAAGEFAHHLLAYVEMFARDAERMAEVRKRAPTGCRSAPPRWPAPATRSTARRWPRRSRMDGVCQNSIDAVSDRDFAIEFTAGGEPGDGARLAPQRGAGALDEPELRLHRARRPLLHRLVDHAAEEEPRRRPSSRAARPAASSAT